MFESMKERLLAHKEARALMAKDQFADAVSCLRGAMDAYGPHVHLLVDLASCYYMLDDFAKYREYTLFTETQFREVFPILNDGTKLHVILGLGKLLEEIGHLQQALDLYAMGMRYWSQMPLSTTITDKIRAQNLRVLSLTGAKEILSQEYALCEQILARETTLEGDLQNSLMLADFKLFGEKVAWARIQTLVRDSKHSQSYRRLLLFNYLAEALKAPQWSPPTDFFTGFDYLQCDTYEKALWDLLKWDHNETPAETLTLHRGDRMSPLSRLRYLHLLQMREGRFELAVEARIKLQFLIQNLDSSSQKMLLGGWDLKSESQSQAILILSEDQLHSRGLKLDLTNSPILQKLFVLMSQAPVWPTEELIANLYQTQMDTESLDRLRVFISRANKRLASELGLPKAFKLNKDQIVLNPHIQITRRGEKSIA